MTTISDFQRQQISDQARRHTEVRRDRADQVKWREYAVMVKDLASGTYPNAGHTAALSLAQSELDVTDDRFTRDLEVAKELAEAIARHAQCIKEWDAIRESDNRTELVVQIKALEVEQEETIARITSEIAVKQEEIQRFRTTEDHVAGSRHSISKWKLSHPYLYTD